jgi:hypothetical protein
MGILGYFPSNLVKETTKFKKDTDTVAIPTAVSITSTSTHSTL